MKGFSIKRLQNKTDLFILFTFTCFFLLILLQHQFVYIGFDDYAYASLSYKYQVPGFSGHQYTLAQAIEFLWNHYLIWGGRILYFTFELLFLRIGLWSIRLVQTIIITGICYFIYKIVASKCNSHHRLIAVLSCFVFFLLQLGVNSNGTYWFSASVLYLWPLLPLLMGGYLFDKYLNTKDKSQVKISTKVLICLLLFFSTFSQEQVSFAALLFLISIIFLHYIKGNRLDYFQGIVVMIAVIGFLILFLAPGNAARQVGDPFYDLSFINALLESIPRVITSYFSSETYLFQIVLYSCCIFCSIVMLKNKKGLYVLNIVYLGVSSLLLYWLITQKDIAEFLVDAFANNKIGIYDASLINTVEKANIIVSLLLIGMLVCIFCCIVNFIYCVLEDSCLLAISLAAVGSMAPMVYSPYFVNRAFIPLIFLLAPFLISVIVYVSNMALVYRAPLQIVLVFVCIASCFNFSLQFYGYYRNNKDQILLDSILEDTAIRIENGETIESVDVYKIFNSSYATLMPYCASDDAIEIMMKHYYNLPLDLHINWLEYER